MNLEFRKSPESLAVLVVGSDTIIEALPARPIQLAHACGALGYDLVVPLSWGDELVAESAVRVIESRAPASAILCTCPLVRDRLFKVGRDLAGSVISLSAPPVAVARHLRANLGERLGSLSFVGRCPGATGALFDATYSPQTLLDLLRGNGIQIETQPETFVDQLPADRRRHVSLPGGCPAPEVLWQRCNEMTLRELEAGDMAVEIAQHLMSSQPTLLDAAVALGCHCSGVTGSSVGASARIAVMSLEPPRSPTPVATDAIILDLTEAITDPRDPRKAGSVSARPPMAVTPPGAIAMKV